VPAVFAAFLIASQISAALAPYPAWAIRPAPPRSAILRTI